MPSSAGKKKSTPSGRRERVHKGLGKPPRSRFPTAPTRLPLFFFFNDPATPEIYTLSLHDALPIFPGRRHVVPDHLELGDQTLNADRERSEEHTSELQSRPHLVCRLLLEKKKD